VASGLFFVLGRGIDQPQTLVYEKEILPLSHRNKRKTSSIVPPQKHMVRVIFATNNYTLERGLIGTLELIQSRNRAVQLKSGRVIFR
jgi:hypothetical protein